MADPVLSTKEVINRLNQITATAAPKASSDFDLNGDEGRAADTRKTPAAVLIPLIEINGELRVILTKRTAALRHHPGQIAFPGGKLEPDDADAAAAALREAREEIGLPPQNVSLIGTFGAHRTITGFSVTPVIGHVIQPFDPVPEPGEVAHIFTVPLTFLMNPAHTRIEGRVWQGTERRYYAMPFGPHYIWGATARMIVGLQDLWHGTS